MELAKGSLRFRFPSLTQVPPQDQYLICSQCFFFLFLFFLRKPLPSLGLEKLCELQALKQLDLPLTTIFNFKGLPEGINQHCNEILILKSVKDCNSDR